MREKRLLGDAPVLEKCTVECAHSNTLSTSIKLLQQFRLCGLHRSCYRIETLQQNAIIVSPLGEAAIAVSNLWYSNVLLS